MLVVLSLAETSPIPMCAIPKDVSIGLTLRSKVLSLVDGSGL